MYQKRQTQQLRVSDVDELVENDEKQWSSAFGAFKELAEYCKDMGIKSAYINRPYSMRVSYVAQVDGDITLP